MIAVSYEPPTRQQIRDAEPRFRTLQWRRLRLSIIVLAACVFTGIVAFTYCLWPLFLVSAVCGCFAVRGTVNYVPIDWTIIIGLDEWWVRLKY